MAAGRDGSGTWKPPTEIQILPNWKAVYLNEKLAWYHTTSHCMAEALKLKGSTFGLAKCPICNSPVPEEAKTLATLQFLNENLKR